MHTPSSILYFENEGRENLAHVLRVVRRVFKKRADLRSSKLVIFTATGEGPVLAYNLLQQYDPKIIAVTFPPGYFVQRGEQRFHPRIHPKVQAFFTGVGIKVISSRLPFDQIEGARTHNEQMALIKDVISLFGGSFSLAIQAVLQACDAGEVELGEKVISITGDSAAVVTAASTRQFLQKDGGLVVNEIFCKPRNLDLTKGKTSPAPIIERMVSPPKAAKQRDLPLRAPSRLQE